MHFSMYNTLNYEHIGQSVPGPGHEPTDFNTYLDGCTCEEACDGNNACLCQRYGKIYTADGLLRPQQRSVPIVECGINCTCCYDGQCDNRVVQNGVQVPLTVFDTGTAKGYGVYCEETLQEGQFVCCYEGEVVGVQEARRRLAALQPGQPNFLFTLKESSAQGSRDIFVDAAHYGNLSRFFNHSCRPNMTIMAVRYTTPLPRIAFFANCRIDAGTELTYPYGVGNFNNADSGGGGGGHLKRCLCATENCQQYLPCDLNSS